MITSVSEQQHRLALYNQGLTDRELAAKLFITCSSVQMWRNKNKLKPNKHVLTLHEAIEKYDGQEGVEGMIEIGPNLKDAIGFLCFAGMVIGSMLIFMKKI